MAISTTLSNIMNQHMFKSKFDNMMELKRQEIYNLKINIKFVNSYLN